MAEHKILHIYAESENGQPYELLACDPDPENEPEDYLPKGFHIIEKQLVELDEDWDSFPSGSTFLNESYLR